MDLRYHEPKTHGGKRVFFQNALRRAIGPRMEMKPLTYDAIQEKMYMEVSYIRTHTHTRCNTLQHTATYCLSNVLTKLLTYDPTQEKMYMEVLYTRTHAHTCCNTLQHTATHCNTLQHTATHCLGNVLTNPLNYDATQEKKILEVLYIRTHTHTHTHTEVMEVCAGAREGESGGRLRGEGGRKWIHIHTYTHTLTHL